MLINFMVRELSLTNVYSIIFLGSSKTPTLVDVMGNPGTLTLGCSNNASSNTTTRGAVALHLNKDQLGYKYVMSTNRSSGAISAAIRYDSGSYSNLSYNTLFSINSFSTSIYFRGGVVQSSGSWNIDIQLSI